MITLKNICKNFGAQIVLQDVNLTIFENDCLALVGNNGSGKTTLLKILVGILEPDDGVIEKQNSIKLGYFPQEISDENNELTAEDFLAEQLTIEKNEIYGEIGSLFHKLQLNPDKLKQKLGLLSGGEKTKILLMLILKSQADIFLLDEPTNNLDLRGLILLENFIESSQKGFLIVSHDRKILDHLVKGIIEIDDQTHHIQIYRNYTYSGYLRECIDKEIQLQESYQDYIDGKHRLERTIRVKKQEAQNIQRGPRKARDRDKFIIGFKKDRSKKIASQASAIEKRLEQMEVVEKPKQPLPLKLKFDLIEKSGDVVFRLKDAKICYGHGFCLGPINLDVSYGDRIVILGPNGEGKTTLLRLLLNQIHPDEGSNLIGHRVNIGYLPQEIQFLPGDTVLEYFLREAALDETNARRILTRFGFTLLDIDTEITKISPGQRSRLTLAILMSHQVNCLVMDEPSNHLDVEALDHLENALKCFPGTIVMVSHDRYFIDQVGMNKTYLLEDGKIRSLVDYHVYEAEILNS